MDGTWMEEWPNNWIEEELNRNPLPVCCKLGRLALEDTNAQLEETELSAEELLRNIYLEDDPPASRLAVGKANLEYWRLCNVYSIYQ